MTRYPPYQKIPLINKPTIKMHKATGGINSSQFSFRLREPRFSQSVESCSVRNTPLLWYLIFNSCSVNSQ